MTFYAVCGAIVATLLVLAWLMLRRGRDVDALEAECSRLRVEREVLRRALRKVGDRILDALDEELDDDPTLAELARRLDRE